VVAGLVGVVVLVAVAAPRGNPALTLSLVIYGCGLLAMLITSALYNGGGAPKHKDLLRRIDHAAIFVMIAGTYNPLVAMKMDGGWSHGLLLYVWAVAVAGVILKLICVDRFPRLSVALYLFLGWTVVVAFEPLSASVEVVPLCWTAWRRS
jgi:hemolysin III